MFINIIFIYDIGKKLNNQAHGMSEVLSDMNITKILRIAHRFSDILFYHIS